MTESEKLVQQREELKAKIKEIDAERIVLGRQVLAIDAMIRSAALQEKADAAAKEAKALIL